MRFVAFAFIAALAACSDGISSVDVPGELPSARTTRDLRWTATATTQNIAPTRLVVRIFGVNHGSRPATVFYGACNAGIKVYAAKADEAVWDSRGVRTVCILPLISRTIFPGDTIVFGYDIDVPDLMADSISDGSYFVSASAAFSWDDGLSDGATTGEILAGAVTLVRAQAPLPAERVADSVSYRASTSVEGDSIVARVTMTNISGSARRTFVVDTVPFATAGYSSAAARDFAWRPGNTKPTWHVGPRWLVWKPVDLPAGATRTFQYRIAVPDIRKTSPAGTYYPVVIVYLPNVSSLILSGEAVSF